MPRSLTLFALKTKEEYQLSQPAIDAVLDSTGDLVESSMEHLKEQITTCLNRNGNPHTSTDDCLRDFCDGEDFKSHGLFGHDSQALVLHCYNMMTLKSPILLAQRQKSIKIGKYLIFLHIHVISL